MWSAKEQTVKSCWISKATVRTFESFSVSGSVLPLWILAFRQSSPRKGGWMGEKSENTSQAVRGPSLKTGKAGRGWWPQLPCEPSDLCPPALFRPAQEVEAAAGDPAHMLSVLKHPEELGLVSGNKSQISNCGLSPFPFVSLPWEHPARKAEAPL